MRMMSTPSSWNLSLTRKTSRLARPGTLTRTALLGSRGWPLWWSSPLIPSRFPSVSLPSSPSQNASTAQRPPKLTAIPSAPTFINLHTPLPDAPRNTPPAYTVRFIILTRLTDVRTQPAQRSVPLNPSPATAAPPQPPLPQMC